MVANAENDDVFLKVTQLRQFGRQADSALRIQLNAVRLGVQQPTKRPHFLSTGRAGRELMSESSENAPREQRQGAVGTGRYNKLPVVLKRLAKWLRHRQPQL